MEPHVILSLQVPGLLAQKAKDVGEVLITNLTKHLQGEQDSNSLPERTLTSPSSLSSAMGAQEECPAVLAKAEEAELCHKCMSSTSYWVPGYARSWGGSLSHRLSLPSQSRAHGLGPTVAPG